MPKKKPIRLSEYAAANGLRATSRLFGRSTQWVLDRYHYTTHFKATGIVDYIKGPVEPEIVKVKYAKE